MTRFDCVHVIRALYIYCVHVILVWSVIEVPHLYGIMLISVRWRFGLLAKVLAK